MKPIENAACNSGSCEQFDPGRQSKQDIRIVPSWLVPPVPHSIGFGLRTGAHHLHRNANSRIEVWSCYVVAYPLTRARLCLENTRQVKGADKITPRILRFDTNERDNYLAITIKRMRSDPIALGL
jgi:hypothetical protein